MGLYLRGLLITFDMKFLIALALFAVTANAAVWQPQDPTIYGGWTPNFLKKPMPIQKPAIIGGWTPDFLKKPVQKPMIIGGWTPAPKCIPHVKIVPHVIHPVCVPVRRVCVPVRRCAPRVIRRSRCCYIRRRYC